MKIIIKKNMDSSNYQTPDQKYSQPLKKSLALKCMPLKWTCVKKVTKFSLYLVILLCTISVQTSNAIPVQASGQRLSLHTQEYRERRYQQLLQEQRSLVVPTPHRHHLHHRSVGIMPQTNSKGEDKSTNGNDVGDYCRTIKQLIHAAKKQAFAAYDSLKNFLGNYVKTQSDPNHKETLEHFYEVWSKQSLALKHPHADIIDRNINIMPNTNIIIPKHLKEDTISDENIKTEFLYIDQTLRILKAVYEEKRKELKDEKHNFYLRREGETDLEFQNRLKIIYKIYDDALRFLEQDLFYTERILEKMKIQPLENLTVSYNKQQIEWLLFQEHLGVMKYLIDVYTYLLDHCNQA